MDIVSRVIGRAYTEPVEVLGSIVSGSSDEVGEDEPFEGDLSTLVYAGPDLLFNTMGVTVYPVFTTRAKLRAFFASVGVVDPGSLTEGLTDAQLSEFTGENKGFGLDLELENQPSGRKLKRLRFTSLLVGGRGVTRLWGE